MLAFVIRRIVIIVPLMLLISLITFVVIQLPPGDYLTTYVNNLRASGTELDEAQIQALTAQFGLDRPFYEQYYRWISNIILHGNFGWSFQWNSSVNDVLAERLPITVALSLTSLIVVWVVAIPIAIISATHQYSIFDYFFTFLGFIGIATPSFLLALVAVWMLYALTGYTVTGLFAKEFMGAAWSWGKFANMMSNAWLPIIIVAVAGTAGLIRVLRATLLDELRKQYVITARSKGLTEGRVLLKYPIRIAMNPIFSTIGWLLPSLVSGQVIVEIVLNLQTVGPVLLRATLAQDMYLTGSIVIILSSLTVIGTFISDLLLAWLDPRIRLG